MDNATFWNKIARKYAKDKISDMPAYEETRDRMRAILQPPHRVLELGCGTGSTALELAAGVDLYLATDVSSEMIAIARAKGGPDHLRFAVGDAGTLPDGPHDVIIALNLLHLVDDLEGTLERIYAALPSGGMFIAKTALLRDGLWILPLIVPLLRAIGKAPYVRNLSGAEYLGLIKQAGFIIDEEIQQKGVAPRLFTTARKP